MTKCENDCNWMVYMPIRHNIITTSGSSLRHQRARTRNIWGCSGVSGSERLARSIGSCGVWIVGWGFHWRYRIVRAEPIRFGEFGGQMKTSNLLWCSLIHFSFQRFHCCPTREGFYRREDFLPCVRWSVSKNVYYSCVKDEGFPSRKLHCNTSSNVTDDTYEWFYWYGWQVNIFCWIVWMASRTWIFIQQEHMIIQMKQSDIFEIIFWMIWNVPLKGLAVEAET